MTKTLTKTAKEIILFSLFVMGVCSGVLLKNTTAHASIDDTVSIDPINFVTPSNSNQRRGRGGACG